MSSLLHSNLHSLKNAHSFSFERGQPHNTHKEALLAGENVVYRLCYNGSAVAGSHAHFLIFNSHAISFWEKTELLGLCRRARGTPHNLSSEPTVSGSPLLLLALHPLFVRYLLPLQRRRSRRRRRCHSNVRALSVASSAVSSAPSGGAV